jgi:hypothetical protein
MVMGRLAFEASYHAPVEALYRNLAERRLCDIVSGIAHENGALRCTRMQQAVCIMGDVL